MHEFLGLPRWDTDILGSVWLLLHLLWYVFLPTFNCRYFLEFIVLLILIAVFVFVLGTTLFHTVYF